MKIFENASVKIKLVIIIVGFSFSVVMVVLLVGFNDFIRSLKDNLRNGSVLNARLVGQYCVAPLSFEYTQEANDVLSKLEAVPTIVNACVYDRNGDVFASFSRDETESVAWPDLQQRDSDEFFDKGLLHVFQLITYRNKEYGHIYLQISTSSIRDQVISELSFLLPVMMVLLIISCLGAFKVQRSISGPIRELADVTQELAHKENYSIRVKKRGTDEIGILYERFNHLCEVIERREMEQDLAETQIHELNEKLELRIRQRTADLERLNEELLKLSRVVEESPSTVMITDLQGTIEYVNPKFEEVTGYSGKEVVGQNPRIVKSGHQPPEFYEGLWKTILAGGVWHGEFLNKKKNGELFWENASISSIRNDSGEITHFVAAMEDITERKRGEEQMARYEFIVNSVRDMMSVITRDYVYQAVNDTLCQTLEIEREDIITKTIAEVWGDELFEKEIKPRFDRCFAGETVVYEISLEYPASGVRVCKITLYPYYSEGTQPSHAVVVTQDITDRKRDEKALVEAKSHLDLAMRSANMGSWIFLIQEGILSFDEAKENLFGIEPGSFAGTIEAWFDFIHPEDVERVTTNVQAVMEIGEAYFEEYRIIRPDGEIRYLNTQGVFFLNSENKPVRATGLTWDITPQKEVEHELTQARDAADKASKAKSRFLSHMSHELRTPLNSILGFTDLLENQFFGSMNEKQLDYARRIKNSGKHLLDLINDLLDVAKIDAGKMVLELEEFSPIDLIDAMMVLLGAQFRKKKIQVGSSIDQSIDVISGDLRKCKQALLNLLSNAIKYTPEKGRIEVRAEREGASAIRISVNDTGSGVPTDEKVDIFSEFYQVDRVRDETLGGTGIGLALTRRLIELHGGEVGVESPSPILRKGEKGPGSLFWFTLPQKLKPQAKPKFGPEPGRKELEDSKKTQGKHRILVAEDNENNLALILDMLSIHGHIVYVAPNGEEAVDLATSHKPDMILMDIRMPVMDGLEATRLLRANPEFAEMPIIALTASVGSNAKEKCIKAGCTGYLAKPIQSADLFAVLERYLKK